MTLLFFDFYPVIHRSSSFGDVFLQASFYACFDRWHLIILGAYFFISFSTLPKHFPSKVLAHSLVLSGVFMLILTGIEYCIYGFRLSDHLMGMAYHFVLLCVAVAFLFVIPRVRNLLFKTEFRSQFLSLKQQHHLLLLALVFTCSFTIGHLVYIPILIVTAVYAFRLHRVSQTLEEQKLRYHTSDVIPLVVLMVIGMLLSFVNVSAVVCHIPLVRDCFSCHLN